MGRPKIHDKHLPQRMRKKGNAYYHVAARWTPLGSDLALAKIRWAELEGVEQGKTFDAALDKYFASQGFSELADNTKRAYMSQSIVLRKVFGRMNCSSIRPDHIYTYMDKSKSRSSANQGLAVIKNALEMARRAGWVQINHANDIKKYVMKGRSHYVTDDAYKAIYEAGSEVVKAAMAIAYLIGQRPIDVLKIRLSDITEDGLQVMQVKTGKAQLFAWTPELRAAVNQAKAIPRPVRGMTLFCNSKGKPYDTREFRYQWAAARKAAGYEDAQFRDMRSKAVTDAKLAGQDHQKLSGHATKKMADHYVKLPIYEKVEPLKRKI